MLKGRMTRRRFLATTAAATAIAMPYVRGAHAAGKLSMGFWDHWVPGANNTTTALVNEWAEKEKVEVSIDYITSSGTRTCSPSPPSRRRNPGTTSSPSRPGSRRRTPRISSRSTTSWPS